MKRGLWNRALSLLLVLSLILGVVPAAYARGGGERTVSFEEVSPDGVAANLTLEAGQVEETPAEKPDANEIVRVSVVLEGRSLLEQGYATAGIASNEAAQSSRRSLEAEQQAVTARISSAIGQELDVAWNLTLAANVISANVRYGDLEKIRQTRGVSQVVLETKYEPCVAEIGGAEPQMASATTMTGSNLAWQSGFTGAGSRIAVIDTGLDADHQSVDDGAFRYALEEDAKAAGEATEDYLSSLDLLDAEEIAAVLPQLNIYKGYQDVHGSFLKDETLTGEALHLTSKIAFAYNYIDRDLDVTHDNDGQGGHGSHVAGIAAANRYIPAAEGYAPAEEIAHTLGVAPDAQLLIMKVFGKNGGAYDSDYMAAIEDAIVLGADVVNLSLGSANPGFTTNDLYQDIMDRLERTDVVVSISAGNAYAWAQYSKNGYLYAEDTNYYTGGAPGAYANAFTVASVDNDGMTGPCFQVGARNVVYTENLGTNQAKLSSLDTQGKGTQYPYIFLDSLGKPEDYAGLDVAGKVVFISRGETSFSEKATAAGAAGAVACIIYNNVPGAAINMDMSQYYGNAPCVGITKADGDAIRAASQAAEGCYTGTITVGSETGTAVYGNDLYTMSDFSSWGVPGNLTLKPEITAPGGNIYSINGATAKTDQYVVMGGTSMASPHNAGLAALLAQYLRESGLEEQLDVSPRTLIQSLLMSTATPIVDGNSGLPYPVIRQGAGLGNAFDAMNAGSYVTVKGQPDGKVKAELGDDPDRQGVYTFDYTLHNMTDTDQQYTLDAQFYTQNAICDENGAWYADYLLTALLADTTYMVNGQEIFPEAGELEGFDFTGDGTVIAAVGQALLDYATGKTDRLDNLELADLDENGRVTAYDAELFLARLGKHVVQLPSGGEVTISVTITLPESVKEQLDEIYTSGAYLEGYVTATPFATEEGVLASAHSIPVLAFYGGWDEADMFDKVTHSQLTANAQDKGSYIPSGQFGISDYNYISMSMGDSEGEYYLGGNHYATDDTYLPERNAIRSNAGDTINQMHFCLLRNAGGLQASIANRQTGEIYAQESWKHIFSAFYFPNYGSWQNVSQSVLPEAAEGKTWAVTDRAGKPLPEGTELEFSLQAAPELYLNGKGQVDWSTLNPESTKMSLPVVVDNTAPVLKAVSVGTETDPDTGESRDFVEAVAQDNRYLAAVILLTPGGTKVVGRQSANQTELGAESRVRLDISGIYGDTFQLAVVDYAGNAAYYQVTVSEPYEGPTATLYGTTNGHSAAVWHSFASNANYDYETVLTTEMSIFGAAYGDGYLFFTADRKIGYEQKAYLYVVDYPSFENPIEIGAISASPYYEKPIPYLAYNTEDGELYYVKQGGLYAVDVADASEVQVATLETDLELSGIAYSIQEQCFYVIGAQYVYDFDKGQIAAPTGLYRFALPEADSGTIQLEQVADFGIWPTITSKLVLDETQHAAYILRGGNLVADLFTYEFETQTLTQTGRIENHTNLVLPDERTADENSIIRTEPTSIALNTGNMDVFVSGSKSLVAEVGPWCLQDKSVVWSTSDPEVATVDQTGKVTGISEGTAVITAQSALDETVATTCTVNVIGTSFTFRGIGAKSDGKSQFFTYDLHSDSLTAGAKPLDMDGAPVSVESASANPADGKVWAQDAFADESGNGYRLHVLDPDSGASTYDSAPNFNTYQDGSLLLSDMAYDNWNGVILGVNGTGKLFMSEDPQANDVGSSWFNLDSNQLVAVARGATRQYYMDKYTMFYVLDGENNRIILCDLSFSTFFGSWTVTMDYYTISNVELAYGADVNGVYQDSMTYDPVTGTPILFHATESGVEIYALSLESSTKTASAMRLGKLEGYENVSAYEAAYTGTRVTGNGEAPILEPQGEQVHLTTAEESPTQGSTNVAGEAAPREEDGMVTVTLRAEEAAASGMVNMELDENLTLLSLESPAQLSSFAERDGLVTFGYAGSEPIAKDGVVAVLRLRHNGQPAQVLATETERGGKTMDRVETIRLNRTGCNGSGTCPSAAFTDLNTGAWYHEYTDFVLDEDLMRGMGNGRFAPNATVTRAMAATLLYRLAGEPEVQEAATFSDVDGKSWYAKAVAWAEDTGIAKGVDANHFAPNAPATREQLATLLYRYAQYAGLDVSAEGNLGNFSDGGMTSAYAVDAMTWAVGTGLLVGDGTGRLLPKEQGTRAQLAALITRFLV